MNNSNHKIEMGMLGIIRAIGVVYGAIETSPRYVLTSIYGRRDHQWENPNYILGAVSCVIGILTIRTSFKPAIITLRADNRAEGRILSL